MEASSATSGSQFPRVEKIPFSLTAISSVNLTLCLIAFFAELVPFLSLRYAIAGTVFMSTGSSLMLISPSKFRRIGLLMALMGAAFMLVTVADIFKAS